jgi:hypothetical protein
LALNYNGMWKAKAFEKLGQHPISVKPKSLSNIVQKAGIISMIDVIVVKKYPIYFTEYIQGKDGSNLRFTRCRETVDII